MVARRFQFFSTLMIYKEAVIQTAVEIKMVNRDKDMFNQYSPLIYIIKKEKNKDTITERVMHNFPAFLGVYVFCNSVCLDVNVGSPINLATAFLSSSLVSTHLLVSIY